MKPKIKLSDWAKRYFANPPNIRTLRRWAKNGNIYPRPIKAGREYVCCPDAEYVDHTTHIAVNPTFDTTHMSSRVREILNNGTA
jgi:hypothetical protein